MSVTVAHDYYFKPDGDVEEGKTVAAEFAEYLKSQPWRQQSFIPLIQLKVRYACSCTQREHAAWHALGHSPRSRKRALDV